MDFGWTRSLKFVHQIFFPHGVLSALLRVFNPAMPDVNFDQNSMRTSIEVLLCRPIDGFLPCPKNLFFIPNMHRNELKRRTSARESF